MNKKLGFAFSAGGSRGVAHIGFLKAMEENGIKPDFISGSSMGAVVGACYSAGMNPDQMYAEAIKLKPKQIVSLSANPIGKGALLRSKKMRKKLEQYLGDLTFNQLKIPFTAIATDIISGTSKSFGGDNNVAECVTASSSMPSIFQPLKKDGMLLIDGGVLNRVPVDEVRTLGAEVVVAVDALGETRTLDKKYNIFGVLLRVFDMMDGKITHMSEEKTKPDLFLSPNLGDMSQYKFKDLELAFNKGYELGLKNADKIKELVKG